VNHVTCLGCGCACDDITVVVREGTILDAEHACPLGRQWLGDGRVPSVIRSGGREVALDVALQDAAQLLARARRPLVFLAGDISCETQRVAVGIADRRGAVVHSPTTEIAAGVLAGQRRGRPTATLAELRLRAELVVCWGVDPSERYPRFASRYLSAGRRTIAVDIGPWRGPADADERLVITADEEIGTLVAMTGAIRGLEPPGEQHAAAVALVRRLAESPYTAIVHDVEPVQPPADPDRTDALIALAQALNEPSRCALASLRGGGNRSGADAVLTWQTGFPMAVDFSRGHPCYRPHEDAATLAARGEIDAALVVGAPDTIGPPLASALSHLPSVAIGPRASTARFQPSVVIDTGVAGIHEPGMAFRMDDVPLPLSAPLAGPVHALAVVQALANHLPLR
jgi:formylmethanofuran dehydrogenase subunit B